jgi:hypothetical protein
MWRFPLPTAACGRGQDAAPTVPGTQPRRLWRREARNCDLTGTGVHGMMLRDRSRTIIALKPPCVNVAIPASHGDLWSWPRRGSHRFRDAAQAALAQRARNCDLTGTGVRGMMLRDRSRSASEVDCSQHSRSHEGLVQGDAGGESLPSHARTCFPNRSSSVGHLHLLSRGWASLASCERPGPSWTRNR